MDDEAHYVRWLIMFVFTAIAVITGAILLFVSAAAPTKSPTYHVVCPSESKNPMDITGEGHAYVAANSWGVIDSKGAAFYFWPGGCVIGK